MVEALLPKRLSGVAKQLGVGPFEVVRLSVASGASLSSHSYTDADVAALTSFADIQHWHEGTPTVVDANPAKARLRSGLKALLDGGYLGSKSTRLDNLWRGLDEAERGIVEAAAAALVQGGQLITTASAKGAQVSISEAGRAEVEALISAGTNPASLSGVF